MVECFRMSLVKGLFDNEMSTSACILLTSSCGEPHSSRHDLKSRFFFFYSNLSLIEFVRCKCNLSLLS